MIARTLLWSLALGLVAWSAWAWGGLPDRIPLHFGIDGTADRWGDRSLWGWFTMPLLALALAALMDGLAQWSLRHPEKETINVPGLEGLTPEQRLPVLRRAATMLAALGAVIAVAFWAFQLGAHAAAHGRPSQGWMLTGLFISLLGHLPVLVWGLWAISAEAKRQRDA